MKGSGWKMTGHSRHITSDQGSELSVTTFCNWLLDIVLPIVLY